MRNRDRHSRQLIDSLRLTIDCLPVSTREAMLTGLRANERIIVGAYVDDHGGVCPMLAAHRCGGRTDFLAFAKSWDRFTRASGVSRPASERELRVLVNYLQDSLASEAGLGLDSAIREHLELCGRTAGARRRRLRDAAEPIGEVIARRLPLARRRPRGQDLPAGGSAERPLQHA